MEGACARSTVFYFSATGNSMYVARKIEENPISIPQAIHDHCLEYTAESIGIVAPIYGHELPPMVKEFMKKAMFKTDYFYMVLTYGNRHGGAAELAKDFCKECGIQVNYINVILTVDNWLPSFDMNEQKKIEWHIRSSLEGCARCRRICGNTCFACAHACPQKAIGLTVPEVNSNARY